ncbi:MAG: M56 family metallopeptidase [Candidatus Hydrogenedentes bacterium]|nr:M56 family metallopeptidase [Candidatus Hydrogenedentota bacterium]
MTANWATLDQWGFAAARYLLEALWRSTLVFAAVAALSAVLRRYTPRARRALWLVALLIAPALPLLSTLAKPAGLPQQSVAAFPVYAPPPVTFELEPEPTVTPTIELPVATVAPPAPTPLDYPWALGLFAYTLGAAFFLAWTLLGHFRIHQWMRSGRAVSDPLLVEPFHRAAARLNVRGPVRVVLTDRVPAPITAGIVRPTVLLPNTITDALTPDDLYAVALHETVHIQQHEPLILTLASLVRSVLYFHPLVWLACRRLAVLAEHTADDAVLEITGAPTAYAKLLTTFAERLPLRTPAAEGAAGLVFCKSAFLKRVEAILGDRNRVRKLTRIALACTVAAVLVSLAGALALPLACFALVLGLSLIPPKLDLTRLRDTVALGLAGVA